MVSVEVRIEEVTGDERRLLDPILDESFTGWYQMHAKRTLRNIERVHAAFLEDRPVGLVMVNRLNHEAGYVYYIAVARQHRGQGVAGRLLDNVLELFFAEGAREVYASVTSEHAEPMELFKSRGFQETGFRELTRKYGMVSAMNLYRKMLVVSGESLLVRERVLTDQ